MFFQDNFNSDLTHSLDPVAIFDIKRLFSATQLEICDTVNHAI